MPFACSNNIFLKGSLTRDFFLHCFSWISVPRAPGYPIRIVSTFLKICEYIHEFSKKFETALMVYSKAWGKLMHEKNQKSKISWHCPFKGTQAWHFFKYYQGYRLRGQKWTFKTKNFCYLASKNWFCSNLEILAKVEIKESNFFRILAKVI